MSEIYDSTLLGFLDILMNVIVTTAEQKRLITGNQIDLQVRILRILYYSINSSDGLNALA